MRIFKRLLSMCLAALMAVSATPYVVFSAGEETVSLEEDGYAVYEAEAAYRSGYAVVEDNSDASGGAVVTNIGGPNTDVGAVVFEDVYAAANAVYQVELYYIAQSAGDFYVMLNEGSTVTVNNESSSSNINVYTMNLRLRSGYNTIKIYSTAETVVKVDCIKVNTEKEITYGVYEDDAASLGGSAQRRRVYGAEDGWAIGGIDQNSSAEFTVNTEAGKYDLFIWYSAYDYRNLDVYVDGEFYTDVFCPITGEDYNIETARVGLDLSAGEHKIAFRGKNSYAPDIDKIQLVASSEQIDDPPSGSTETGLLEMGNGDIEVKYDLSSGTADFYSGGTLRVSGIESAVKVETVDEYRNEPIDTAIKSSDYSARTYETEALNDGYGTGTLYKILSTGCAYGDMPDMRQNIRIYDGLPYAIIDVELLSDASISTNFMAPISAAGEDIVNIGNVDDGRTLFVPYDNDNWVRYNANSINGNNTSYWATAVYDNTSRNAIVFGSLDHDTFKTGTNVSGADNKINFLGGFGGIWSAQYTYDYLPHGSIDGTQVKSPKFMLGYFDDWRDGMEAYGEANEINNSKLNWNGGAPFGYNSWYAQGTNLNFTESARASDFIAGLDDFKSDDGVAYINLDSYWDFMSDDELRAFVQKCHSNGQKAGIYWSHFVGWSKDMSYGSGVGNRPMRDAALEDKYGNVVSMAKTNDSYPLDPTSEVMEERMRSLMTKFVDMGFEFLKVDFLNYAAIEGVHADPEIKTGMQAYNKALSDLMSYVDTDNFFISLSIAPLFPSSFAHSRRISCDVGEGIDDVEYMLNSLTYGWWEDDTLYSYTDPDHIVLSDDLTYSRTRYTAAAISGTLMLLSNLYSDETMRGVTEEVTSNKAVNDLARKGKAFRPVEGNTGDEAGDVFILDEGKSVYVAMFNTDYYNIFGAIVPIKKTVMLDLERIGLSGGQTYEVTDLWTGETSNVSGTISKVLEGSGSALLRIDTPDRPSSDDPGSDELYYEDFESDTIEAEVRQKENGWSWDGSDEDTVTATEAGIWVGDNGSGSKGLRFATGDTWFKSNWLVLDADEAVEAYGSDVSKLGEDLSISFKAKFEIQGLDTNTDPPEHYIRIKGRDQQSIAEVSVKKGKLNLIALNSDGAENVAYEIMDIDTSMATTEWHNFEFRFDMSKNKFALLVDGELVTEAAEDGWAPVSNKAGVGEITEPIQEIGAIDSIEFGNYYAGWWQCMYLDDLKIDSADYSENITEWSIDNIEIDSEIVLGEENEFTLTYTHPSDPQPAQLMVAVYRGESLYDLYTVDLTPSEKEGSEDVTFKIGIPEDISEARAYIWTPELEPLCDSFDINVY